MNYKNILAVAVLIAVIGVFSLVQGPWQTFGSVNVAQEYRSTTTPQVADRTNLCPAKLGLASSTTGVLGSVNITTSGAGEVVIYDATTTNSALRTPPAATSSLILASFQGSPTVGSYHFDVEFKRGLLIDYTTTGTGVSSTTISYRCY